MDTVEICFGCHAELNHLDRDPSGEKNATCARCRAEESHDFDAEPGVVFSRSGMRLPRGEKAKLRNSR